MCLKKKKNITTDQHNKREMVAKKAKRNFKRETAHLNFLID